MVHETTALVMLGLFMFFMGAVAIAYWYDGREKLKK